ncbi:hypothetical protein [Raineya sp.]
MQYVGTIMLNFSKHIGQIYSFYSLLRFLESEEAQEALLAMEQATFDDLDVLNLTEDEENELKLLYELSVLITRIGLLAEKFIKPFENIRKRLEPLFIDQNTYLLQEPNAQKLAKSLQEVQEGKVIRL